MIVSAGDPPTTQRRALWDSSIHRSFEGVDGLRRMDDLLAQMKPVEIDGKLRHKVYLGKDERVMRVVRKIIRGLSHHHKIKTAVPDQFVWADFLRYQIPGGINEEMHCCHRDPNIVEYRYQEINADGISSVWVITFFKTVSFIGNVSVGERNIALHVA
jgi:hypothetical protein